MRSAPPLVVVLADEAPHGCPYAKVNFIQFLAEKHCIENYDSYAEIAHIHASIEAGGNPIKQWTALYAEYVETDKLNLPESITSAVSKFTLPSPTMFEEIKAVLMGYLFTSYSEFTAQVRRREEEECPLDVLPSVSSSFSSVVHSSASEGICDYTNRMSRDLSEGETPKSSRAHVPSQPAPCSPTEPTSELLAPAAWSKFTRTLSRWRRSSSSSTNS